MIMKKFLYFLFLLFTCTTFAQDIDYNDYRSLIKISYPLTVEDSIYLSRLPVLKLPEDYRYRELPAVVDNSVNPYFRPVISQESYPNCMQSTSIIYNFTYEIDRARDLLANEQANQYTSHFAWNFMNGGDGWYGVNYLHTFEILEKCGTPNLIDYGGLYTGGGERWMTGYDKYYNAMQNRIEGIFAMPVGNMDGLLTLKHWLYDHLEGSDVGGVASFIACSPWNNIPLPEGTPEGGKRVIVEFWPEALHGMTIVGYNDSIRYDYNEDGQYTNDVDINGDGIVDLKDWEIGGLKFANSYGNTWADSGFCYMMYRTLAETQNNGGIWANVVHVVRVKETYSPMLTMKVILKHNSREMIKVVAGVAADTSRPFPTNILEFPIFDFQGGDHFMQGSDTSELNKTIEFGLDITPLLSYVTPGQPAEFYLQVCERDPKNKGIGEIVSFLIMDYTNGVNEIPYPLMYVPLNDNNVTVLVLSATLNFDKPQIITGEIPPFQAGQPYNYQLEAAGGVPPYRWKLRNKYSIYDDHATFPGITVNQLIPNINGDSILTQPLEFSFPFYGEQYDTVKINAKGYIFFEDQIVHWSYMKDQSYYFRHIKSIAPFKSKVLEIYPDQGDGLWYEGNENYALFRWKASVVGQEGLSNLNFAVKLFPGGNIACYYGNVSYIDNIDWVAGISNGDKKNFHILDYTDPKTIPHGFVREYIYHHYPPEMNISDDGILNITAEDTTRIYDLYVVVTDYNNMYATKTLQFSNALNIDYTIKAEGDTIIENNEEVTIDYSVTNLSQQTLENTVVTISNTDQYVTIPDGIENFGNISPGEIKTIINAFTFRVDSITPDNHLVVFRNMITTNAGFWEKQISSTVKAPSLGLDNIFVSDSNNGRLDPGETTDLIVTIKNLGHSNADEVYGTLIANNVYVHIQCPQLLNFGLIESGNTSVQTYSVTADIETPNGYNASFVLNINDVSGFARSDTFEVMIGKMPVLIVDMDPKNHSGPVIEKTLDKMDVNNAYTTGYPEDVSDFQSVFLCLGIHFSNYVLTWEQGNMLAGYLNNGGKLFMEGRTTWNDIPQTTVHDMFNLDIVDQPSLFEIIQGIDSTFTEGMQFENLAQYAFNYYYLEPVPPAYTIFESQSDQFPCGVAYDAGNYKTIGTIFEFGALLDDTSTKINLMEKILEFFEIEYSVIGMQEINNNNPVIYAYNYPNPFKNHTDIIFTLKGNNTIDLDIFNLHGQHIRSLLSDINFHKGTHIVTWDTRDINGQDLPGGVYIYRLRSNDHIITGKMVLTE